MVWVSNQSLCYLTSDHKIFRFLSLRISYPVLHCSYRFPGISSLHIWRSFSLWRGEGYGLLKLHLSHSVCSGVPFWGYLLTHLHHHLYSGDGTACQKKSLQQRTKVCDIGYPSLHRRWWTFYYQIHTNHNTKSICNIWWDLPATHVIKMACCFYIARIEWQMSH